MKKDLTKMRDWLQLKNHGFARVAAISPVVGLGDPRQNAASHIAEITKAYNKGAIYVVSPELGLTGYSCQDGFYHDLLLDSAEDALQYVCDAFANKNILISVGMPLRVGGALFNCAVSIFLGKIVAIVPKSYLPTYGEFYEGRWFTKAGDALVNTASLNGQDDIPFGPDILIESLHDTRFVLHTEVCEDGWVAIPPSAIAALSGATVLANLSASNVTIGKDSYRRDLMTTSSAKNLAVQLYCSAGFGESTTDLAWDGHSMIVDRGEIQSESQRFSLTGTHIVSDVNLAVISMERRRQNTFIINGGACGKKMRRVAIPLQGRSDATFTDVLRAVPRFPFVPPAGPELDQRCEEVFVMQATSLARRLSHLPENLQKVVVGASGGKDSTHALLVAVRAMDLLELPRTNVIAITMEGFGTTKETNDYAIKICTALGVTLNITPIKKVASLLMELVGHDQSVENTTFENSQAWSRMFLELVKSCAEGAIVMGTGTMSELMLGWCTMFGDHASHYNPNSGVAKTLISVLLLWTADHVFAQEKEVGDVLRDIVARPASPDLLSADEDSEVVQITEDAIGPYELHDFFIYHMLRFGMRPTTIARLALHAFDGLYDLATIKKWLTVFISRFITLQVKRSCLPDGPKVGHISPSPRGDLRWPSDMLLRMWLEEVESIPVE